MSTLLLSLWLALDVQGTITCPSPTEVSQHLARLVPEGGKAEPSPHAYLSSGKGVVTIELLSAEGVLLSERRLDQSGSCGEMAEAVAVILAAWQAKFSPTVAPTTLPPPPSVPAVTAPIPQVVPKQPLLFDVGLAALTSIVSSEAAFGAKLEGALIPFAYGLGFHLAASASSSHTQSTSQPIKAQWFRPALTLGPNLRLHGKSLALDLHGDAVLALVHVKGSGSGGSGTSETASDTTAQLGLAAGLRGLWAWNHAAAWVGIDLLGFPGQDNLTFGKTESIGRLPHLEIQVSLGIALGRFR